MSALTCPECFGDGLHSRSFATDKCPTCRGHRTVSRDTYDLWILHQAELRNGTVMFIPRNGAPRETVLPLEENWCRARVTRMETPNDRISYRCQQAIHPPGTRHRAETVDGAYLWYGEGT